MKQYSYSELSEIAQERAIRDYQKGWTETHMPMQDWEIENILLNDLPDDRYTKQGKLIEGIY